MCLLCQSVVRLWKAPKVWLYLSVPWFLENCLLQTSKARNDRQTQKRQEGRGRDREKPADRAERRGQSPGKSQRESRTRAAGEQGPIGRKIQTGELKDKDRITAGETQEEDKTG